eukprot:m.222201 g.222201  ORF g.222201 m.222201 type:complete len:1332 (-) comp10729_c0_seq1:65-4060(-)
MASEIAVIDTGVANTASILAVLERAGGKPFLTTDAEVVRTAKLVVLPGVGAFGPAVEFLSSKGLMAPLHERIEKNMSTLSVCLGFQLLAMSSEESPGAKGIGVLPTDVVRFPSGCSTPQQGWNRVTADPRCKILKSGFAYFSNSFCMRSTPAGWTSCETNHGIPFVSAVERGRVVACQFHPELSGTLGFGILKRWIAAADTEATVPDYRSNLCRRVIPCLDVADGRVVKGIKFQELRDAGDPVEQAARYESNGADELVMLDISATTEGRATTLETVRRLRGRISMPLTVGGGVKSVEDAGRILSAGADKIAVNTAAVVNPELLTQLSDRFGNQCTVLAIDAVRAGPGKWEVVVKSGKEKTGIDVVQWAIDGVKRGAGEILLTSFDQDGTKAGYDCDLLKAVSSAVSVPVIASGGASNAGHLVDAIDAGSDAVLAASIFHYNETTIEELKSALVQHGIQIRTSGYFGASEDHGSNSNNMQPFLPLVSVEQGRAVGVVHNGKEITDVRDAVKLLALGGEITIKALDDVPATRAAVLGALNLVSCRIYANFTDVGLTYLDAGATMIIVRWPTVASWAQFPKERMCAVVEAVKGPDGWLLAGRPVAEALETLAAQFGTIMFNFADAPIDVAALKRWAKACAATGTGVCVCSSKAGIADIAACDRASVLLVLPSEVLNNHGFADALTSVLVSDRPDGLWPTIVADECHRVLGLAYSSAASVRAALEQRRGVYQSRARGLWIKGESSGATQDLLGIQVDCDRDTICFVVRQHGLGFCHRNMASCLRADSGLSGLLKTLHERRISAPEGSYTKKLYTDGTLLASKLVEEAIELSEAVAPDHVAEEAADLMYFMLVACTKAGVNLAAIERVLDTRSLKVTRRSGNPKRTLVAQRLEKMALTMRTWERAGSVQAIVEPPKGTLRRIAPDAVPALHRDPVDPSARSIAESILMDVRDYGEAALRNHALRLGDIKDGEQLVLAPADLKAAFDALDPAQQGVLQRTADRIRKFAEAQCNSVDKACKLSVPGGEAGQTIAPVEVAGCYAPGGRYPLPSSVLMGAITARVAGVKTVWVASPRPHAIVLAAAHVAGVDGLLAAGGAQAIAAFTYGAGGVPVCDAIVGPGNKFVTAAKSLVAGSVAIDMLAGPSECLVVADETADAATVASDLLAQAEHDTAARAILVSTSQELIDKVDVELQAQLATLPTAATAIVAIDRNSFAVKVATLAEAADIANRLAPEHLEIHIRDAPSHVDLFEHYGALFVGHHAAEVLGDYGAGPNHTLPTGGTARSFGGLSVHTFRRMRTWLRVDDLTASRDMVEDAVALALCEGLHGHARAAQARLV